MSETIDANDPTGPTVAIDYMKSSNFRAVRADGVIGAVTPSNHIHFAFYSERSAIPRRITHEITPEGRLGAVRETESRGSIVREMDFDVFLSIDVAESFHKWLGERIEEAKGRPK